MAFIGIDGRTYPTVLTSHKDKRTYRVCTWTRDDGEVFYCAAHPGYDIPHDCDYVADCPTYADAQMLAANRQRSDELMGTI